MKSSIRNIGNSKGIILPQSFLKACLIDDEVNIEVKDNYIIISAPDDAKRKGWESAFREMAKNGDDDLVIPDMFIGENIKDWTW